MIRWNRFTESIVLAATMTVALAGMGCAARGRVYDEYHGDYHRWDDREDHAYRGWLADRHYEYHDYKDLDKDKQHEYWNWRHEHPNG